MGREHRRPAHFIERRLETGAALLQVADALQHGKRGVALVEVKHGWLYAERLERAHAADAEDDFLLHARFAVAAVGQADGRDPTVRSPRGRCRAGTE